MVITVKFFASVREALGASSESLALPDGVNTVGALRDHLAARGENWQQALSHPALRMACNQVMCSADTALADGAEVAFFPPVTGG
ncbi:molybdopterin synthase subunit MoaD [Duganella sacchari]|uniref:Molybdopterin synthase sulfur carrier subunit n=1 Tax=Duganella sacchari TaxID=551987 RepID=A0A1M7KEQ4_9BURK|nr:MULTISPECIES: molybdopterin converting factor subunit 1 [Duganella]MYM28469.1 molybdopterin converting factor subunit 1 [Duganella sp. CY15W]SHM63682.1 molybdopterin synthase subunit MoaD [Duganella sacchari]